MPLDDERQWYRYHHLFAEVLRQRLTKSTPADAIASLHHRASVWYARQGLVAEAVQHALTAADSAWVADLIEQHGLRIIVGGQIHTVLRCAKKGRWFKAAKQVGHFMADLLTDDATWQKWKR